MKNFLYLSVIIILTSCGSGSQFVRNKEAREDAAKMAEAKALRALVPHKIEVDVETVPVASEMGADAADDPAIWYNPAIPEQSVIIGTNKKSGLYTYDINGTELDYVPCGKVNNVDVRSGFPYKDKTINLVAATNRTTQGISLFALNSDTGKLSEKLGEIKTNGDDVYGFTMYQDGDQFYAIANSKDGLIEQFLLEEVDGKIVGENHRGLRVKSQPEGMVVDEKTNTLYVGVEEFYIELFSAKAIDAQNRGDQPKYIQSSTKADNEFISYDIEGLALLPHNDKTYLIASIQGSFSYAIFDVTNPSISAPYITSFSLVDNQTGVDGVEETDGLEVLAKPLGRKFPAGILVVQDGFNFDEGVPVNQNFKIVDLRKIIEILE